MPLNEQIKHKMELQTMVRTFLKDASTTFEQGLQQALDKQTYIRSQFAGNLNWRLEWTGEQIQR